MNYKPFLQWWLVFTLICVGGVFAYFYNLHLQVWKNDWTYITLLILSLFSLTTLYLGGVTWKIRKKPLIKTEVDRQIEHGWFMASNFMKLGLFGSVIGFITMLSAFLKVDLSQAQTVQNLIVDLSLGVSVALYTTAGGIMCNLLTSLQTYLLNNEWQKIKNAR